VTLEFIETRVDFAIIERLGTFTDRFEQERFGIEFRVNAKDIQHDSRGRPIVPTTDNVAIANNEQQLPLVVVVESRKGVDRPSK
jgi:hypothetical protein